MKTLLVVVMTAGLLVACSTDNAPESNDAAKVSTPSAETISLKIGESVEVPVIHATIAFDTVLEDSRCPTDVECVWEGNARTGLRLVSDELSESFELNTSQQGGATVHTVNGYELSIDRLEPKPVSTRGIDPRLYSLELRLKKQ